MDFKVHPLDQNIRNNLSISKVPVSQGFYIYEEEDYANNFWKQHIDESKHEQYQCYRKEWHRRPQFNDYGNMPLSVIIELNSGCNLSCNMCYTITDAFKSSVIGDQRMMPWPMVTQVIDECDELEVPSILFSWRGEATLYRSIDPETGQTKDFADVLSYATSKPNILEVTSLTHGQNIDEDMAERIVKAQPNWISFSVDGKNDVYNAIRKPQVARQRGETPDVFSKVLNNIRLVRAARQRLGLSKPLIRSNTIFPAISDNPSAYRDILKEAGVDLVTVNELLEWSLHDDGSISMDSVQQNWSCQYPFQRLTVSANGVIVPCNGAVHEESGLVVGTYNSDHNKGRAKSSTANNNKCLETAKLYSIRSAWHSPELNYIRDMHSSNRRLEIDPGCRNCNHGLKKKGVSWIPSNWDQERMIWK